ncbi:MAG: hypothetical protein U9N01_04790, partial [Euryarchaeota archaeon]|nr:hypothetical protein [Euryarchaeota archaeon]
MYKFFRYSLITAQHVIPSLLCLIVFAVFLIWYRRTKAAYGAGFRYIMVHSFGGMCLLAGVLIHLHNGYSLAFDS